MSRIVFCPIGIILYLLSSFGALAQDKKPALFDSLNLVVPGAMLKKVSGQFSFTEGPAVNRKGDIYFTDQPNNRIWKYSTKGRLSLYLEPSGRSNGLYFDRQGNLIACADLNDELWKIAPDKSITVLLSDFQGKRLNGPNDLWIDRSGGIYFTDPYYQRPYWKRTSSDLAGQYVYYLAPGAGKPVIADSTLAKPNGIVGSADGKWLYVADIGDWKTYRYRISGDGQLLDRTLFVNQGADGITLDAMGNLYLSGNGVTVYNPAGTRIAYIPVPENWTANLCFGGRDRKTLFLTAGTSIYSLRMSVNGIE